MAERSERFADLRSSGTADLQFERPDNQQNRCVSSPLACDTPSPFLACRGQANCNDSERERESQIHEEYKDLTGVVFYSGGLLR